MNEFENVPASDVEEISQEIERDHSFGHLLLELFATRSTLVLDPLDDLFETLWDRSITNQAVVVVSSQR